MYLPGGDPDLIPALLRQLGRRASDARVYEGGAVLAGASAGAMGLAAWTWTSGGGIEGLGFVPGLAVFPHYDESRRAGLAGQPRADRAGRLGYLGLDERTGVISRARIPTRGSLRARVPSTGSRPAVFEPVVVGAGERVCRSSRSPGGRRRPR